MNSNGKIPSTDLILAADGRSAREVFPEVYDRDSDSIEAEAKMFGTMFTSYLRALQGSSAPARERAKKPFLNHPWIFAASMAIATTASQAPYTIYKETDKERQSRPGVRRRGLRRTAMRRYSRSSAYKRIMQKALEPDFDHDLNELFDNPNPHQDGRQLWQMTFLLLGGPEGECFWILTDDDGEPVSPGSKPTRIWPLSGAFLTPIQESIGQGELVGWRLRSPSWMPLSFSGTQIELTLDQIIQFKLPNPENPLRGISRLTPVALAIENDLAISTLNARTLDNSGVPKGGLKYPGKLGDKEKEKLLKWWEQRHSGSENASKLALLVGGLTYEQYAQTSLEGQYLQQKDANRTEELAVMATPDSVLGVSDAQTYATQLGQDKNFWDKNLIPLMRLIESAIDRSALFFEEDDALLGLFDLSQVEALRAGLESKVLTANTMCGSNLHMPPKTAFTVVGLEVDEYEGDDTGLVPLSLVKVEDVLVSLDDEPSPTEPPPEDIEEPEEDEDGPDEDTDGPPEEEPEPGSAPGEGKSGHAVITSKRRKARGRKTQRGLLLLEVVHERKMRPRYRSWVREEKTATLANFNELTSLRGLEAARKAGKLDLRAILPDLKDSMSRLSGKVRPLYPVTTEAAYEFSLDEIGIPVFGIDDPSIVSYWNQRANVFLRNTPKTVFDNLRKSLSQGIQLGESLDSLKARVASVYNLSASSAKVLQIVRTETAGLMNGVRREMFDAQGFEKTDWIDSGDEHTRMDHVLFGAAEPQELGFNYLSLVGQEGEGFLAFPGDTRGPAKQVIHCRCAEVPA